MMLSELFHLYHIVRIMLRYGLDELIPNLRIKFPLRIWLKCLFWMQNHHTDKLLGERLRLAFQELGPVWIKFGQMMSTRRDLFPPEIADQLAILQDRVDPFDGNLAREQISLSMGGLPLESWFDDFNILPLASASISQVHTARLKVNGQEVIIKVIRPDIISVIKADMKLMKRLAYWLPMFLQDGRHLNPQEVVREYEKTLLDELNLLREAANAIQLRRNFDGSKMLYIPEIYLDYCSENMLVMERIYGISVSDVKALKANGINMPLLAARGIQVFFTQVFRDSFFHADMHPGNIFISYNHPDNPQYIEIDFEIVGSLHKEDKRYLAENLIAFFNRDYRRVAELHVNSGWVPSDTNIQEFEFSLRTVCEPIFEKPLADISFGHVLLNLFNIARRFNMEIQPQLVLLQKTLLYVEGLGRLLYPQLNLWKTAKPFLESWLKDQMSVAAFIRELQIKTPFWMEKLPEIPELIYDGLRQNRLLHHSVMQLTHEIRVQGARQNQSYYLLGFSASLLLAGFLMLVWPQKLMEIISEGLIIAGLISWVIGWHRFR